MLWVLIRSTSVRCFYQGANEYPQHMFLWRNKKKISILFFFEKQLIWSYAQKEHMFIMSCLNQMKDMHSMAWKPILNIWAASSEKMPSNMHKMQIFRLSCASAKYHPGLCSSHYKNMPIQIY